jgi:predicted ATPase
MNAALKSFTIRSFRGLRDLAFQDLGRFNLLVGDNNSGKTSILEALLLFAQPGDGKNWLRVLKARGAQLNSEILGDSIGWLFGREGRDPNSPWSPIELEGHGAHGSESLRLSLHLESKVVDLATRDKEVSGDASEDDEKVLSVAHVDAEWTSSKDGSKSGEMVFEPIPQRGMQGSFRARFDAAVKAIRKIPAVLAKPNVHRNSKAASTAYTAAIQRNLKTRLVHAAQAFDPDILDLELVAQADVTSVFVIHGKLGPVPLHTFGDGLRKAIVVTGMALEASDGILLLDEAETALHVHAQDKFFAGLHQLCEELNVQVFMTTHSLDAVDSVLRAVGNHSESVVGFHLDKADGVRTLKRFSGDMMERLRFERGLDIR